MMLQSENGDVLSNRTYNLKTVTYSYDLKTVTSPKVILSKAFI